jgi:hypothetical protein
MILQQGLGDHTNVMPQKKAPRETGQSSNPGGAQHHPAFRIVAVSLG